MREFFKPLRRKLGVVTLAMACVVTALWIESHGRRYCYAIPLSSDRAVVFELLNGQMGLCVEDWIDPPLADPDNGVFREDLLEYATLDQYHDIPYISCWVVSAPVTLLSACLLLGRPRSTTKPGSSLPPKPDHA